MFLAETIWQQQEGTLMSMEGTLSFIGILLVVLLGLVLIIGLSLEMKLGRANRIARATHDLIEALLEETKKANAMLQHLNDREFEKAKKVGENTERPTPNAQSRMEEKKPEPTVYRID